MTNQHPITPPPELVREWCAHSNEHESYDQFWFYIATQAAQWGADQELEACCVEVSWQEGKVLAAKLRDRRRPKPPTLKEQALESVKRFELGQDELSDLAVIRRALEALPND
jgi:hypothetical protein